MESSGGSLIAETPDEAIVWGGKSQAIAVRSVLARTGTRLVAIFDDTPNLGSPFDDVPLHPGSQFPVWLQSQQARSLGFAVAIGNPHGRARLLIHERLVAAGLRPLTVVDPQASVDASAELGAGCQVFAGAVVSVNARIGRQCIVNCQSLVEHEVTLGDGVEVAPAAVVLGLAQIADFATIGARATVLARVHIGADVVIGADCLVGTDVQAGAEVFGDVRRIF